MWHDTSAIIASKLSRNKSKMLSPAKALRYECLAAPVISGSSGDTSEGGQNGAEGTRCQKRSLGNGYTLDLTETIPHVVKDGHKLVRNCSTGKTVSTYIPQFSHRLLANLPAAEEFFSDFVSGFNYRYLIDVQIRNILGVLTKLI